MRWIKRIWTAAILMAATSGCKQQCFIKECDYQHTRDQLAGALYHMPEAGQAPAVSVLHTPEPKTVLNPDRPVRFVSLAEAQSTALEQGRRGSLALNGQSDDSQALQSFQNVGNISSDHIRVLALDPAIAQATLESSLSKFDAVFQSSTNWNV